MHGRELWKTDGHYSGTQIVKDITPGALGSTITYPASFAGKLFFLNAGHLWSSDGTAQGTYAIEDSGIINVYIYGILAAGNKLFISGCSPMSGVQLYVGEPDVQTGKLVMSRAADEKLIKTELPFNAMVYPNPVLSNATLQITGNNKNLFISIIDMSGKKLWQSKNSKA